MRTRLLLVLFSLLVTAVPALGQMASIRFDTVATRLVGPGMRYTAIRAPTVPWNIFVLEVDLTNPYVDLEQVKARDLRAGGRETTSSMAARRNVPGRRVVGAINAGFFASDGAVNSPQINAGEVIGPMTQTGIDYSTIAFNPRNRGFAAALRVTAQVQTKTGSRAVTAYNGTRTTDALVLYNRFQGASTNTNAVGRELLLRPLDPWTVNGGPVRAVVDQQADRVGNMSIPAGRVVLSGHGASETFLQGVAVGDTVRITQSTTPAGLQNIDYAVSGRSLFVSNGVKTTLPTSTHHSDRHPRTAMGLNQDTTKLWLVVVDGRTAQSAGMTNYEQQDLFLRLGAWTAQGLDGGGSSTMVVDGAIQNYPSDGTERSVGDAFLVFSTAPAGPLEHLTLSPRSAQLFQGEAATFVARGTDAFGAPVTLDPTKTVFDVVPAARGSVDANGRFVAGASAGSGFVRIRYDGVLRDSAAITVTALSRLDVTPADAVTDTTRTITFKAQPYDNTNAPQTLAPGSIAWRVLDPSVGTIDASGVFRGRAVGATQVVASVGGIADTARVRVEVGTTRRVVLRIDDAAPWQAETPSTFDPSATALTLADVPAASGGKALRFDYRFTHNGSTPTVRLRVEPQTLFGVPDTVFVHMQSSSVANHRIYLEYTDAADQSFVVVVPRYVNDTDKLAPMPGPFSRAGVTTPITYPVRFTGIRLDVNAPGGLVSGQTYNGTFWVDQIVARYPGQPVSSETEARPGSGLSFVGAAPNPTTGRTRVTFTSSRTQSVRLTVYDVLGRERSVVYDGPMAAGEHVVEADVSLLPGGLYFVHGEGFSKPLMLRIVR